MLRRGGLAFASSVVLVAAWAACVGDDPTLPAASERGAQNQLCFENDTCLAGLACVAGRCQVDADGATSTSTSSSTSSSSSSSSSGTVDSGGGDDDDDAGTGTFHNGPKRCGLLTDSNFATCPTSSHPTNDDTCSLVKRLCCPGRGCINANDAPCPAAVGTYECFSSFQCGQGERCCMQGTPAEEATLQCDNNRRIGQSGPRGSRCSATCNAGEVEICRDGRHADCSGSNPRCTRIAVDLASSTAPGVDYKRAVGICTQAPISCPILSSGPGPTCPIATNTDVQCAAGERCCSGDGCIGGPPGTCVDSDGGATGKTPISCFATSQCGSGRCCFDATLTPGAGVGCGVPDGLSLSTPGSVPFCQSASGACTGVQLCTLDASTGSDCPPGKRCIATQVNMAGAGSVTYPRVVGVCR